MPRIDLLRLGFWLVFGWLAAILLFRQYPAIDRAVTALFWSPEAGFPLAQDARVEWLRNAIWNFAIAVFVGSALALAWTWRRGGRLAGLAARGWGFVFALFLLGPGLVVNGWLKAYSGRARPAQTTDFGGDKLFSRAGDFTDQCSNNCSFVSGEVAATAALAMSVWVITAAFPQGWGWLRRGARGAAVLMTAFVMLQRIATGRHFASDAVFAVLITLSLGWVLHLALRGRARTLE